MLRRFISFKGGNRVTLAIVLALQLSGCNDLPRLPDTEKARALEKIIIQKGPAINDAMYGCLANALVQGIPYLAALQGCETKLLGEQASGGGAPSGPTGTSTGGGKMFDPTSVKAACFSGDPTKSSDAPPGGGSDVFSSHGKDWGTYSWGSGTGFNGLTYAQSAQAKADAVRQAELLRQAADLADDAYHKVLDVTGSHYVPGAQQLVNTAAKAAIEAAAKANAAAQNAEQDPNKSATPPTPPTPTKPPKPKPTGSDGGTQPGGQTPKQQGSEDSPCEQVLQAAREFVYECNRNGWKSYECQQLKARMEGCPDPALILVDPDQGYACGSRADPVAVANAYRERCQQLTQGVDGQDPCAPKVVTDGRFISDAAFDVCRSPFALIDPESNACATPLKVRDLGGGIEDVILFGLNHLGGPIFVLPANPRPSGWNPKPEPRPGPRGGPLP